MVALPCWPFQLSPLKELYWGKLLSSITLIPFEIILIIFGRHVYQVKTVCRVNEWLLSLAGLLSYIVYPLN